MLYVAFASAWYTTASALFWATFALVVLGIVTLAISSFAWRSSLIKRRLLCSIVSCTRLLAAPEPVRENLEVFLEGRPVSDPYVIALEIANVGRTSIPSELFDKGRGLIFGLNAPILKILTVEHEPVSAPTPVFSVTNDMWELKPELIARGELIQLSLLTAGAVNGVAVNQNPLADVSVQVRDRQAWLAQRARRRSVIVVAIASCAFIVTALSLISTYNALKANAKAYETSNFAAVIGCHNLRHTVGLIQFSMKAAYSEIDVRRDGNGHLRSVGFGPSYKTHVTVAGDSLLGLLDAYSLATNQIPGAKFFAVQDTIATASNSLGKLPTEGIGSKASRDLKLISAGLKALSSKELRPSLCADN